MLQLILVTAPVDEPDDASVTRLRDALAITPLSEALAPAVHAPAARAIAAPHALIPTIDARLGDPASAIAVIEEVAARSEGTLLAVVDEVVARAIVRHALAAPVADTRFTVDPGTYAEIEVRLDAPWTVNRLNEGCHGNGEWSALRADGIVQT